jgi:hypothetical protein
MAALIPLATGAILLGMAFLGLCLAIRKEDRFRGSLRCDAPSWSARVARSLVGFSSSRWD